MLDNDLDHIGGGSSRLIVKEKEVWIETLRQIGGAEFPARWQPWRVCGSLGVAGILHGIFSIASMESNQVRLLDESDKKWKITVPSGLMREVVRPHFEERVRILGRAIKRKRYHLYLDHIESANGTAVT